MSFHSSNFSVCILFRKHNHNIIITSKNMIRYPNSAQIAPNSSFINILSLFEKDSKYNAYIAITWNVSEDFLIQRSHLYFSSFGRGSGGGGGSLKLTCWRSQGNLSYGDSHCSSFTLTSLWYCLPYFSFPCIPSKLKGLNASSDFGPIFGSNSPQHGLPR